MSEKNIHIVFQVLNFVSNYCSIDYQLTTTDRLLLLILAKHHGVKGIYPSFTTLAKELKVTPRQVQKRILYLESQDLLIVDRKKGKSNYYTLSKVIHNQGTVVPYSAADQGTPVPYTQELQDTNQGTPVPPINTDNQNRRNKTERGRDKTAPPSLSDFLPDETNLMLCGDLNLNPVDELASFKARYSGKTHALQYEFSRWLKDSAAYRTRKANGNGHASNGAAKQEVRCTVPDYGPGHPTWEANQEWERKHGRDTQRTEVSGGHTRGNGVRKIEDYVLSK